MTNADPNLNRIDITETGKENDETLFAQQCGISQITHRLMCILGSVKADMYSTSYYLTEIQDEKKEEQFEEIQAVIDRVESQYEELITTLKEVVIMSARHSIDYRSGVYL